MNHNFIIGPTDTDSISFCKEDMSKFTDEDRKQLVKEINDISPEFMQWDDDGLYLVCISVRAKNYALWDGKKLTIKGSSLKATVKSPAMKEYIQRIIQTIIDEKYDYLTIYNSYVKEIMNIEDIKRFAVRKTLTDKVFAAERTSEAKLLSAVEDSENEMRQGDKAYVFYKEDNSLCLCENFDGKDYNRTRLLKNLFDTAMCFSTIIPKEMFVNYSLKRNQKLLSEFT